MNTDNFLHGILNDLAVELTDDFDRSFERKSFFGTPWAPAKSSSPLGSLMLRSGSLRQSIRHSISGHAITWQSSLPYASIMNAGGTIIVTAQMKKYFWAKYYEAMGGIEKKKDGSPRANAANRRISADALHWKRLALMKVGHKMVVPARPFIGYHPQVSEIVRKTVHRNLSEIEKEIADKLRRGGR